MKGDTEVGKRFKAISRRPVREQKKNDRLATFIAQGRLDDAVRLLRRRIMHHPTDENKRLLIGYLCAMKQHQDALEIYNSLEELTTYDLLSLALVFFQLEE